MRLRGPLSDLLNLKEHWSSEQSPVFEAMTVVIQAQRNAVMLGD